MQIKNKIAVIGGTGKSGLFLTRELLKQNFPIKMLLRNPSRLQIENSLIEVVEGDARDPKAIHALMNRCVALISTLGQPAGESSIFSEATRNVIRAMDFFQIKRYIVTTGLSVDCALDAKTGYTASATEWMKTNYTKTTADKQIEWEELSASGLDWTLVRLPLIDLTEIKTGIRVSLTDCPGEKINATSLAVFLVDQLNDTGYLKQSPFIATAD